MVMAWLRLALVATVTTVAIAVLVFAIVFVSENHIREPFSYAYGPQPTPRADDPKILKLMGCFALNKKEHSLDEGKAPFYTKAFDAASFVDLEKALVAHMAALPTTDSVFVLVALSEQTNRVQGRLCCPSLSKDARAAGLNFVGASHRYLHRFMHSLVYEPDDQTQCTRTCPDGPMDRFVKKYPFHFTSESLAADLPPFFAFRIMVPSSVYLYATKDEAALATGELPCGFVPAKQPDYTDKSKPPPKDGYYTAYAMKGKDLLRMDIMYAGMELYPVVAIPIGNDQTVTDHECRLVSQNGQYTLSVDPVMGLVLTGSAVRWTINPQPGSVYTKATLNDNGQLSLLYMDHQNDERVAWKTGGTQPGAMVLSNDGRLTIGAAEDGMASMDAAIQQTGFGMWNAPTAPGFDFGSLTDMSDPIAVARANWSAGQRERMAATEDAHAPLHHQQRRQQSTDIYSMTATDQRSSSC